MRRPGGLSQMRIRPRASGATPTRSIHRCDEEEVIFTHGNRGGSAHLATRATPTVQATDRVVRVRVGEGVSVCAAAIQPATLHVRKSISTEHAYVC